MFSTLGIFNFFSPVKFMIAPIKISNTREKFPLEIKSQDFHDQISNMYFEKGSLP